MAVESFPFTITVLGAPGDADEGQPKTGATVYLKKNGTNYLGSELGTTGNYTWASLEAGRYELIVNSVSRGEVFGNGVGIVAGLGNQADSFIVNNGTTHEFKTAAQVLSIIGALPLVGGTISGALTLLSSLIIGTKEIIGIVVTGDSTSTSDDRVLPSTSWLPTAYYTKIFADALFFPFTGGAVSGNIEPNTPDSINLGSVTKRFLNIHGFWGFFTGLLTAIGGLKTESSITGPTSTRFDILNGSSNSLTRIHGGIDDTETHFELYGETAGAVAKRNFARIVLRGAGVFDVVDSANIQQMILGQFTGLWLLKQLTASGGITDGTSDYSVSEYGEIHLHDNTLPQTIPTGITYTKITLFTDAGPDSTNVTSNATTDNITVGVAGDYEIYISSSFYSNAVNTTFKMAAFKNGVEINNVHWERKVGTGADVGNASDGGIVSLLAGDIIDLRVRHDDGGSINLTPTYCKLKLVHV